MLCRPLNHKIILLLLNHSNSATVMNCCVNTLYAGHLKCDPSERVILPTNGSPPTTPGGWLIPGGRRRKAAIKEKRDSRDRAICSLWSKCCPRCQWLTLTSNLTPVREEDSMSLRKEESSEQLSSCPRSVSEFQNSLAGHVLLGLLDNAAPYRKFKGMHLCSE